VLYSWTYFPGSEGVIVVFALTCAAMQGLPAYQPPSTQNLGKDTVTIVSLR
jgi:hypothetical protein